MDTFFSEYLRGYAFLANIFEKNRKSPFKPVNMHGALVDLLIEGERVNNFVTLSLKIFVILNMIYFIKRKKKFNLVVDFIYLNIRLRSKRI